MVVISSSWVEISLHIEFQLPRLPESRTVSFIWLNPILGGVGWGDGGSPQYFLLLIFLLVGLK